MCLSLRFSGYNRLKDVTGCGCDEKSLDVLERLGRYYSMVLMKEFNVSNFIDDFSVICIISKH